MTDFNATQFMDDVQSAALESKYTPIPIGDYPAALLADTIKVEPVTFKNGEIGARFRAQWQIDGEVVGMTNPKVRQDFLLNITGWHGDPANGGRPILKTGKNQNIDLGKLVVLSGQRPDEWSYRGLGAARGRVRVTHRPDKTDPDKVYAEVSAVAPL